MGGVPPDGREVGQILSVGGGGRAAERRAGEGGRRDADDQQDPTQCKLDCVADEVFRANEGPAQQEARYDEQAAGHD